MLALRARQQRNFLATLFLAQGVPMLLGGDELGRTQRGNNNGYCQDNDLSWFDWAHADHDLFAFTCKLIAFYRSYRVFRRRRWFRSPKEIHWVRADGDAMEEADWKEGRSVGVLLDHEEDADRFFVFVHAGPEPIAPTLPPGRWQLVFDTDVGFVEAPRAIEALPARSLAVWRMVPS